MGEKQGGKRIRKQTCIPEGDLLTKEQVMRDLGISHSTFFANIRKYPRHFRTFKSGRNRVMERDDLAAWKAFRKVMDQPR